jgi:hypothetical protein
MATNYTYVTHPDGTVSKRGSKTRAYTHAVVEGPIDPLKYADYLDKQAAEADRTADGIEAALVEPQVKIKNRNLGWRNEDPDVGYNGKHVYHGFEIFLNGAYYSANSHSDSKGVVDVPSKYTHGVEPIAEAEDGRGVLLPGRDYILAVARDALSTKRLAAVDLRNQAAALRSGDLSSLSHNALGYGVMRWSSREDLAYKALSEFAYSVERGHTVYVVPVDQEV